MHPLLWKALLRLGLLQAYVCFFAWVFTIIERRDESSQDRMGKMLTDLRTEINIKYNMTDDDFERFVRTATAAMSTGDELDWTFLNSGEFVFAALTTIGKSHGYEKLPTRGEKRGQGAADGGIVINTFKSVRRILTFSCYGDLKEVINEIVYDLVRFMIVFDYVKNWPQIGQLVLLRRTFK